MLYTKEIALSACLHDGCVRRDNIKRSNGERWIWRSTPDNKYHLKAELPRVIGQIGDIKPKVHDNMLTLLSYHPINISSEPKSS